MYSSLEIVTMRMQIFTYHAWMQPLHYTCFFLSCHETGFVPVFRSCFKYMRLLLSIVHYICTFQKVLRDISIKPDRKASPLFGLLSDLGIFLGRYTSISSISIHMCIMYEQFLYYELYYIIYDCLPVDPVSLYLFV